LRHFIILYFICTLSIYALPQAVEGFIRQSGISKKDISIYIKEVGTNGHVLVSHNARTPRTPASVIKVLSTYASILELGFDYKIPTKIYVTGTINNGTLQGDLAVKGFGDPTLNAKDLDKIVANIQAKGIHQINGNIIIDRSFFRVGTKDNSGFDEHLYSPYNAMPDAMMYNERISTVYIKPRQNNVSKRGADGSYTVINKLKTVNKPCRGRYSWPGVRIDKSKSTPVVLLQGKISSKCRQQNICNVITKPYLSFYYALKDKLKKAGVSISGNMRLRKVPQQARPLFTHYSRSLEKIVSKTAKKSNNLYARHLLLNLGAKVFGAPSTLDKGRRAVESILKQHNALNTDTLKIDNGCGLSHEAKLTAKLLADMLDNAYETYGQRWMDTLSVAGVDGTIKRRFRGTVVKNKAWMKTGTLKRTKNISGYVKNASGQLYEVVILVKSNKGNWRASGLQNQVIKWLARRKGGHPSSASKVEKKLIPKHTGGMSILSSDEKYYVQAGSFEEAPKESFLSKIEKIGLQYKVRDVGTHKVLVGPYSNEADARSILAKIREQVNPKAFITIR